MRNIIASTAMAALFVSACAISGATGGPKTEAGSLSGDYVEARTASVFAGACHYNGELTTTGRDAEIVWHVRSGVSHGVDVSGLTAIAAVSAGDNLKDDISGRRSVL